jgi:hypothetical protein
VAAVGALEWIHLLPLIISLAIADTRTDKPILLGHALLQHQHAGQFNLDLSFITQ